MLNEKRTQRIMKSKFLIFLSAVAMLLLFSNCGSKTTSNDQATTEVKDTVTSKEEAVPDSVSILGDQVYDIVNTAPEFPGGMKACLEFLYKNITYPAQAIESKQEGQVVIQFVVTKNGKIIDPKVVKSVSPSLDAEAIRIINLMPDWTPGKQKNGQEVNSRFTLPVLHLNDIIIYKNAGRCFSALPAFLFPKTKNMVYICILFGIIY